MGLFTKIKDAKVSEGGVYILPGVFRFKIKGVKTIQTRKGYPAFIVDVEVLESTNTERLPGSMCSWMVKMVEDSPALGNVKQFLAAVLGCKEEQIEESIAEAAISEKQPLAGQMVRASATNIKTKRGDDFTKVTWINDAAGAAEAAKVHAAG